MKTGKIGAALALVGMLCAAPAQACWTNAEADAAKIANLNMMMMVSALRCRNGQDNFLAEYNRFVSLNNGVLGSENLVLRDHFARLYGTKAADNAMDRFVIEFANSYGGGHENMGCAELRSVAGMLASQVHGSTGLLDVADTYVEQFALPGGNCPVSIASK